MTLKVLQYKCTTTALVLAGALTSLVAEAQGVFRDPGLHEAVRVELVNLGADPGETIEADELVGVGFTEFTNNSGLIFDVTGLEHATDLVHLDLASNRIFDVEPLAELRNLEFLSLAFNGDTIKPEWLSDFTPLRRLTNLRELDIAYNHVVEDISFVQDLINLEVLDISFNKMEDIGPVYNLVNLRELHAPFNEIKNISMLTDLPFLEVADLAYNEITDIKPLAKNVGLDTGDVVRLRNNPLNRTSLCAEIASLESRQINLDVASVCLNFTEQDYLDVILDVTVPDQQTLAAMDLNADFLVDSADLIRFLGGGAMTTIPDVRGDSFNSAVVTIEDTFNLNVGNIIATAPFANVPAVQVVSQDPPGTPVQEKTDVNVTVTIPPDKFDFLTKGTGVSDEVGREEALAYYRAIDPLNRKDTLAKFIAENNFGQPGGLEADATYFSEFDLALGRDMHMRKDGANVAFYVTNHVTVDDAWQNQNAPLATVAMEYSPGPNGGDPFIKFYTFDKDGNRDIEVNLDGRGERYQPNMCMTCHGGSPGFLVDGEWNAFVSGLGIVNTGNTGARFVAFDLDSLSYSKISKEHSRQSQEPEFKKMNRAVRDHLVHMQSVTSYDIQDTIDLIEGWYGGPGMTGDFNENYVPPAWQVDSNLYLNVVAKSCRTCHVQQVSSIDFASFAEFQGSASTIGNYVFEDGYMPNTLKSFRDFWLTPNRANILAAFVQAYDGRNFTDIGPGYPDAFFSVSGDTSSAGNVITLNASGSSFANEYEWTILGTPPNSNVSTSSLSDRNASVATFTTDTETGLSGEGYIVQLKVTKGGLESTSQEDIRVNEQTVSYSGRIVGLFSSTNTNTGAACNSCHNSANTSGTGFNNNINDITAAQIHDELTVEASFSEGLPRVIPGDASNSLIVRQMVNGHSGSELVGTELQDLQTWINEGALEN